VQSSPVEDESGWVIEARPIALRHRRHSCKDLGGIMLSKSKKREEKKEKTEKERKRVIAGELKAIYVNYVWRDRELPAREGRLFKF